MTLRSGFLLVVASTALAGCHLIFQYEDEPGSDGAPGLDQALADKKVPPADKKAPPGDKKAPPTDKGALPLDQGGPPNCGDGVKQSGEACDYGNPLNSQLPDAPCRTTCIKPYCGDLIVDQGRGEQCDGQGAAWCNKTCRLVTPSLLAPEPVALHFGAMGKGCAATVSRTLYINNPSDKNIVLTTYATDGCAGTFTVSNSLKGQTIGPGGRKPLTVTFSPGSQGIVSCALVLSAADGKAVVPLTAFVTGKTSVTDYFLQDHKRPVDLLMLVDNSGTMKDQKGAVDGSAPLIAAQALKYKTDLHLGVVYMKENSTTLRGAMYGYPVYLTSTNVSQNNIKSRLPVSYNGSSVEEGFGVINSALTPPLTVDVRKGCGSNCPKGSSCTGSACQGINKGFRRAHADLALMVFTDEDDDTKALNATQFVAAMQQQVNPLLGQIVRVQAILDLAKCKTNKSMSNYPRWAGVINKHSGVAKDICDPLLATHYTSLASAAMGPRRWFRLTRIPTATSGSMKVKINGQVIKETSYAWKAGGNGILMSTAPAHDAIITVNYPTKCP